MSDRVVAKRYAKALLSLAADQDAVESVHAELDALHSALADAGGALELLCNPAVPPGPKLAALDAAAAQAGLSDLVRRFLRRLVEAGRMDALSEIAATFASLVRQRLGRLDVVVSAARPVPEPQQQALQAALESKTGKQVSLTFEQDPALLAGARLRIGNAVLDGSADGRLRLLGQRLAQGV